MFMVPLCSCRFFFLIYHFPDIAMLANNAYSMSRIINWHSDTWNSENATVLLTNLQKNRGQTNETREHSALILSWMNLRQSITHPSPPPPPPVSIQSPSISEDADRRTRRSDTDTSSLISPRNSIQFDIDTLKSGIYNNGNILSSPPPS